jgi:hypothetical protein
VDRLIGEVLLQFVSLSFLLSPDNVFLELFLVSIFSSSDSLDSSSASSAASLRTTLL